jgi:hypothetical protein
MVLTEPEYSVWQVLVLTMGKTVTVKYLLFSVVCTLSNLMVLSEPEHAVWQVAVLTMGTTAYSKIFYVLFSVLCVLCTLSNLMVLTEPEYAVWQIAVFAMGTTAYSRIFYYSLLFVHYRTCWYLQNQNMQSGRLRYSQWGQQHTVEYFTIFCCLYIIKLYGTYRTSLCSLGGCGTHNGDNHNSKIFYYLLLFIHYQT